MFVVGYEDGLMVVLATTYFPDSRLGIWIKPQISQSSKESPTFQMLIWKRTNDEVGHMVLGSWVVAIRHCTCETAPMCRRTAVYQSMEDSDLGLVQTCEQEMGREMMWKSKKSCSHGSEDHGKVVHMWNTGTDEFRIRSQIWSNDVRSIEASKQFDSCQEKEGLGCVKPKLWVSENGLYGCYTGIRYTFQISRLFRRNTMINQWI